MKKLFITLLLLLLPLQVQAGMVPSGGATIIASSMSDLADPTAGIANELGAFSHTVDLSEDGTYCYRMNEDTTDMICYTVADGVLKITLHGDAVFEVGDIESIGTISGRKKVTTVTGNVILSTSDYDGYIFATAAASIGCPDCSTNTLGAKLTFFVRDSGELVTLTSNGDPQDQWVLTSETTAIGEGVRLGGAGGGAAAYQKYAFMCFEDDKWYKIYEDEECDGDSGSVTCDVYDYHLAGSNFWAVGNSASAELSGTIINIDSGQGNKTVCEIEVYSEGKGGGSLVDIDYFCLIYTVSGNDLDTLVTNAVSDSVDGEDILTAGFNSWTKFTFSTPPTLSDNTNYAIVIKPVADGDAYTDTTYYSATNFWYVGRNDSGGLGDMTGGLISGILPYKWDDDGTYYDHNSGDDFNIRISNQ